MEINDISGGLLSNSLVSPSSGSIPTMEMTIEWLSIFFSSSSTRSTRCHVLSKLSSYLALGSREHETIASKSHHKAAHHLQAPKTTQLSDDNGYKCRKKANKAEKIVIILRAASNRGDDGVWSSSLLSWQAPFRVDLIRWTLGRHQNDLRVFLLLAISSRPLIVRMSLSLSLSHSGLRR